MILLQGSTWLQMKTTGDIHTRARNTAQLMGLLVVAAFVAAGFWIQNIDGYTIVSAIDGNAASNPLNKEVSVKRVHGWRTLRNIHYFGLLQR